MINRATGLLRHALPGVAAGVAGAGVIGLVGSRGDPAGIPAGVGGLFGGGPSGMFSGAVLGGLAGAAAIGLAGVHSGFRKQLSSAVVGALHTGPVQQLGRMMSHLPQNAPGAAFRQAAVDQMQRYTRMPQAVAMEHLQGYLQRKIHRRYAMGALVGATAGGVIGTPLGAAQRAYSAGAEL